MEANNQNTCVCDSKQTNLLFSSFDVVGEDESVLNASAIPVQLTDGGIFICLEGEGEFVLDMKSYTIKKGDLCIAFPFSILQTVRQSRDCRGYGLAVNVELINEINIPSSTSFYLYIKDNPCIALTQEKQTLLLELCEMILRKCNEEPHLFQSEIINRLFMIICYEIAAIYDNGEPNEQQAISRKDQLFRSFLFLLAKNYNRHREVDFYAGELFVTPRYLSSVIKEMSGQGALQWINETVIMQAKYLLNTTQMSIQRISEELNFANPSFFGQYFKKYSGMTPKAFRQSRQIFCT